ncbi:MAG: sigma-70 family RNA polymerase sigma factor [Verrucomicrobiota bacterium]
MSDPNSSTQTAAADHHSSTAIDWMEMLRRHDQQLRQTVAARLSGGHEHHVDDIMQELAIAVTNSTCPPESEEKALPWLCQIARHKVQDHWRKVQRQQRLNTRLENCPPEQNPIPTPFEWVMQIESKEQILSALDQLPEKDRELLLQKYRQEKNCQQLARDQGISLKSIEYRLTRARGLLRRILNSSQETQSL